MISTETSDDQQQKKNQNSKFKTQNIKKYQNSEKINLNRYENSTKIQDLYIST